VLFSFSYFTYFNRYSFFFPESCDVITAADTFLFFQKKNVIWESLTFDDVRSLLFFDLCRRERKLGGTL
jgi:hypothetical protein